MMSDNECRELYEYILKQLEQLAVREDIIDEIESLRYRDVLNDRKPRRKKRTGEKIDDSGQISIFAMEEEIGKTEMRQLTDRERLLKAMEIIEIYALTIPSIPHRIRQNLMGHSDKSILWRTDDNKITGNFALIDLECFDLDELQKGWQIFKEIIEEVKADGDIN